jgi:hypothetical protein
MFIRIPFWQMLHLTQEEIEQMLMTYKLSRIKLKEAQDGQSEAEAQD